MRIYSAPKLSCWTKTYLHLWNYRLTDNLSDSANQKQPAKDQRTKDLKMVDVDPKFLPVIRG